MGRVDDNLFSFVYQGRSSRRFAGRIFIQDFKKSCESHRIETCACYPGPFKQPKGVELREFNG